MPDLDFARLNDELFDALVHRQSVQAVISRAYACIGLPIIAFGVSFKLLGYAFPRPFGYPYWEQIAAQGQLSTDIIDGEGTLSYQEMMYSNRKSKVFDWGTAKDYPQVDGPIMQGGSLVGYVGIGIQGYRDIDGLLEANDPCPCGIRSGTRAPPIPCAAPPRACSCWTKLRATRDSRSPPSARRPMSLPF